MRFDPFDPGGCTVSIVVRFTPKGLTAEQYDRTVRILEEREGAWPPDGLDYHVCFGSDGNLLVSEIWDSEEQFEEFGKLLTPVLAEAGITADDPPVRFEVHNIFKR
jgi:hypothetical protein